VRKGGCGLYRNPGSLSDLGAPSRGRPPSSRLPRSLRAHSTDYVSVTIAARCRCGSAAAGEPKSDRLLGGPLATSLRKAHLARKSDPGLRIRVRAGFPPPRSKPAVSRQQKPRLLLPKTKLMSEKAPRATFSNQLRAGFPPPRSKPARYWRGCSRRHRARALARDRGGRRAPSTPAPQTRAFWLKNAGG
jgi:hypothetical protein